MTDIIGKEKALSEYAGEDRVVSIDEVRADLCQWKDPFKFSSGIPLIDFYTDGGFEVGEYICLSGISGMGKTTLARTLSWNFALKNVASLWFSYEEIYRDFSRRLPRGLLVYLPFKLIDSRMDWVEERIWEARLKYDTRAIFIDHLHFLVDRLKMRNPSLEIGSICRRLVQIAQNHRVVIFLIAHLTKTNFDEEPGMDDLRDSSFVYQDAHKVFIVWRKSKTGEYTNEAILKICKDRRSGVMGKKISLVFHDNIFSQKESNYDE